MPFNFFETHNLLMAVEQLTPPTTFLRDRYFPTNDATDVFATNDVLVEYKDGSKRVAPFVAPRKGGVTILRSGYEVLRFEPPFVAPRRMLTIDDLNKRGFGEALLSTLTPEQRQRALVLKDVQELSDMITRREEAMAAEVMQTNGCIMKHIADDVDTADTKQISFENGEIVAVNGEKFEDKVAAIRCIEEIGAKYGIGRDMHIGDTIIGIKGRVGFEAAAPMLIISAHKMLEKHTLTKWQQYWKEQIGTWYGMFLHEAQYLDPVMRDLEAFLESTQQNVTGTVEIILRPYSYTMVGVESSFDLMKTDFGEYGEVNKAWTADDVKGFTKIMSNPIKIYHNVQKRNNK